MINAQDNSLPGAKSLIVGLGKTGLSCARYLLAQGEVVTITDTREEPPGLAELRAEMPNVALFLGGFRRSAFHNVDLIVISPGVSPATPEIEAAKARGISVIGDIELFARAIRAQATAVAAITGSNGKSTVTTLLGLMAARSGRRVAVGGNLGKPALDLLNQQADLFVLELSSFQLETVTSLQPTVATVLNLTADHMDRYVDLHEYARVKARVLSRAEHTVLNADDRYVSRMQGGKQHWTFTVNEPEGRRQFGLLEYRDGLWLGREDDPFLPVSDLRTPGMHNWANALAALAMGSALGLNREAMIEALRSFSGLAHRTEYIGEVNDVSFINDSKGTNVGACRAALEGLHNASGGLSVLIAGGDSKGADFSGLVPVVAHCARGVVLIGRDADEIKQTLGDVVPTVRASDMKDAVDRAVELAQPGDRILLSPACASFDMYRNYEHRGDVFAEHVRALLS